MKKIYGILLITAVIAFMTACGGTPISDKEVAADNLESALPESFIILNVEEWTNNEYTTNILQPESGTFLRGWIDPDKDICYVELSDMTQSNSEQYVKALKESGFSEIENVSEEINNDYVSIGTILKNSDTYISISYTNDLFVMSIKKEQ